MFDMLSRKAYVLTTAAIYFIPLCYFYVRFFEVFSPGNLTRIVLFACIVTATPITRGMMMGQPDLCGIMVIMILLDYCIRTDFSKFKISQGIICGIMLFLPFLFRRWYAYTIVSLYITIPFFNMFIFRQGRVEAKKIFNIFFTFFIAGCISILCVYIIQYELFKRILETSYSVEYSAYHQSIMSSAFLFINTGGIWSLIFIFLSICIIPVSNNKVEKTVICFCLANIILIFTLFTQTQSPGPHHQLPFFLFTYILFGMVITHFLEKQNIINTVSIVAIFFGVAIISLFQYLIQSPAYDKFCLSRYNIIAGHIILLPFYNFDNPKFNKKKNDIYYQADGYLTKESPLHMFEIRIISLFPVTFNPLVSKNINEYYKIVDFMRDHLENNDKAAFITSSMILNSSHLVPLLYEKYGISEDTQNFFKTRIADENHVDLRDGPPFAFLKANYVLVASPLQLHLPKGQDVMRIPYESFMNNTDIAHSYTQVPSDITLSRFGEDVKVHIFRKTAPLRKDDLREFYNKFIKIYPDWGQKYKANIEEIINQAI